ncbi:UDP-glucose dehydrogenase family protein [Metabacillus halosaccharovorans]|uniref:UDP-glucose 6-dehydrogenase n=1 Tax=Metabacillus halosaccharovorans TaxID=930124 RepID=A0ABT3DCH5_9BACI|nr:UDP-glucose/GDP-mannose dehydrogenase family protein [Metabacillus halosaccharovorans]MCV9884758.1 UDP-glucose/GDP-mannose dehydrogenase family protein [Metabacillus halosaccharovorans]
MKISVVGTGYVGLVTGVCLAEIGHDVTCIDINENKVKLLNSGKSPIYEPGLEELMVKNIEEKRLGFTNDLEKGYHGAEVIYIAVGTPQKEDGSADLSFVEGVAKDIAAYLRNDTIVVVKSTVPVGTNEQVLNIINSLIDKKYYVSIVSNPEFLREGSAVKDTFNGDRIVIGFEDDIAGQVLEEVNKPFGIPIFKTDVRSSEMIKYASNAFLATKISFINEIANICEKLNANIEDVSKGMGLDQRIGQHFLNAGIGYGGSCFPKDTKALVQIAGENFYDFELLSSVIKVNSSQQLILLEKLRDRLGNLRGKQIALWGLAFKPNTDDMREAPSIAITRKLIEEGAQVLAYDPIAIDNAKHVLRKEVSYANSFTDAIKGADALLILTEWNEVKQFNLSEIHEYMAAPIIIDGRNCFELDEARKANVEYYSIGRPPITLGK